VLFGTMALAVDFASWRGQESNLQAIADAAALAAARELPTLGLDQDRIQAMATNVVKASMGADEPVDIQASASAATNQVRVILRQERRDWLSRAFHDDPGLVSVEAVAQAFGLKVCVIGLEDDAAGTVHLEESARLSAGDCAVYSNSKSGEGVRSLNAASVRSSLTCSSGGYVGDDHNFQPAPLTDCPATIDPLGARPAPEVGSCLPGKHVYVNVKKRLRPGTYCGGLIVGARATITLDPGIYVIKDGPLIVGPGGRICGPGGEEDEEEDGEEDGGEDEDEDEEEDAGCVNLAGGASLKGEGVGFYFTGTVKAGVLGLVDAMRLEPASVVELSAPTDGPMAGLLFFEDRASPPLRRFMVMSVDARKLVGTIYTNQGRFIVDTNEEVAEESAYTAIVTHRLELYGAPDLVLNTNYNATDVPVPRGIGPVSEVYLAR